MSDQQQENLHQTRLTASGLPSGQPGQFEILAITPGSGNGWIFSETVLKNSLELWDKLECFIDHEGWFSSGRSLRDLAGICTGPTWSADPQGIALTLKASGPSAPLLEAMGREWLDAEPGSARPRIGFSADVVFTASKNEVKTILRVLSLDLVFNPARGGAFVRALNSAIEGGYLMSDQIQNMAAPAPQQPEQKPQQPPAAPQPESLSGSELATVQKSLLATLLDARLAAANLPAPVTNQLRRQFAGANYKPLDLDSAIDDARQMLADLTASQVISGPHMSGMVTSEDRIQAALEDLLDAPRDKSMEGVKVERLTGFRELYLAMTGDVDLTGVYDARRAKLATTATLPYLVANVLNKIVVQTWEDLGRSGYLWWQPIVSVQHFNTLNSISGILVGELGGALPTVPESGSYGSLNIADSAETGSWAKYGGYLPLTLELIDRDDVSKLKTYPKKLANAQIRKLSSLVSSVFTASSDTGPVMADTYHVFDASNHGNLGTTALSAAEWDVACTAVYNQDMLVATGETAPLLACDPRFLLVAREKRLPAWRILYPDLVYEATYFSNNLQKQSMGDVICVPDWTDDHKWAAVCDPAIAPAIIVGERFGLKPEIFVAGDDQSPAMFTNDEVRLKVRSFLSVFVADYRPMYKENATA